MWTTLVILAVTAVLFAVGKIRSDIVALCALIALLLAGILTPAEALSGFSNPVVIMMAGLFIVGGGVLQTGLAKMLSGRLLRLAGQSELKMFLLVMVGTAGIGAFVSNTGTVALMLPIVVSMAASAKTDAARLLMPLAFASSMGGMLTLIGTPPNLVIDEALAGAGYEGLKFFSFLPVGLVCMAVGIVVLLPLSKLFLSRRENGETGKAQRGKTLKELVREYNLADDVSRCVVAKGSAAIGRTVAELDIRQQYGLTVVEIRRERSHQRGLIKDISQSMATPDVRLQEGDIIYLSGDEQLAARLAKDYGLGLSFDAGGLDFYDIGLAEIVLLRRSKFVGRRISESGFRAKYSINVLGIRRGAEYIKDDLAAQKLQTGDVLLVQGSWQNIGRLSNDEEHWVVLGQPLDEAAKVTLDYKAPLAACIMLLMVGMMVFDFIPVAPVTAVLIASVLMILTGCFRSVEAAYKTINWESIVLIAAMMPMSVALEKTVPRPWCRS
ncbi:MAG: SLC13 family permease, partial [Bacteroidaceae bacterium]|nr:SLC13 family permease [Bacteroidaceae bacterium]